jgi:two-component system chemotaxis response regulator CheY
MPRVLIASEPSMGSIGQQGSMTGRLKSIVEGLGCEVIGLARSSNEAVYLYRRLKPDVVTMDIGMRNNRGALALKDILQEDPMARVVMVTDMGDEEKRIDALKIGASGFIRRPFKWEEIFSEIHRVAARDDDDGEDGPA